jgi:hypothetical protein
MRLLFLALTIIGITPCMAQRGTLDSLLPRLKRTKEDTIKVNLYIDIAYAYFFIRTDSSYYFAQLGEGLSGQLKSQPRTDPASRTTPDNLRPSQPSRSDR